MEIDGQLIALTAKKGDRPVVASHPVYQYLATHSARWMTWGAEAAPASVGKLEEMEVKSLIFDPCMNKPETGDFMSVIRTNVKALGTA